jgi:hypothetical protein
LIWRERGNGGRKWSGVEFAEEEEEECGGEDGENAYADCVGAIDDEDVEAQCGGDRAEEVDCVVGEW